MAKRVLYPMAGDTIGGSHLTTLALVEGLNKQRFEPVIALHDAGGPMAAILKSYEDVSNIAFPKSAKDLLAHVPSFFKSVHRARNYIKDRNISCVQCDDGPLRQIWCYASLWAGIPYVHYQQGVSRMNLEKKIAYRYFSAGVSNSLYTKSLLPSLSERILQAVAYPVVSVTCRPEDKAANRLDVMQQYGLDEGVKLVGYVANMQNWKHPQTFIKTAQRVKEETERRVIFMMVGDFRGEIGPELKDLAVESALEDDLIFTGFQEDVHKFISAFDVMVACSVGEPFGRTLVEAMKLGTPVVASDSGGHKEIIENEVTGFLVPPDSAGLFAGKVRALLEDDVLYADITAAAQEQGQQKFSAEAPVKIFEDIYARLV